jgi:hypothetical protein
LLFFCFAVLKRMGQVGCRIDLRPLSPAMLDALFLMGE